MQVEHSQDEELAIHIRMIPALAFAAPHEVCGLFAEVAAQLPTPEADGLIQYFERTYIGRTLPGGAYQRALFPIGMWNHHFDTVYRFPRTTNSVEAWHRSFNVCNSRVSSSKYMEISSCTKAGTGSCGEVSQAKYIAEEKVQKAKNVLAVSSQVGTYISHTTYGDCNELIEETARHRKLIFGMWESFGYGSTKF